MRRYKVKQKPKEISFEEVFLDKIAKQRQAEAGLIARTLEIPLKKINFFALLLLSFILILILFLAAFRIQALEHKDYQFLANQNKFRIVNLKSQRGIIFDKNREQLVWNEPSFDLIFEPGLVPEQERASLADEIAWVLGEDKVLIAEKMNSTEDRVVVARELEHQDLVLLEAKKEELTGFLIEKRNLRHYQNIESLSHILGYLGKISQDELVKLVDYEISDFAGREGLEKSYENALCEKKGKIQIEQTAAGRELAREIVREPASGDSLVLHLDLNLQKKAEQVLKQVLGEVGAERGVVIALDPSNGGVLASVSLPGFDNNLFSKGISAEDFDRLNNDPNNPQLNRAISGLYPIGSTIKPIIALAALQENLIEPDRELYCPLELCVPLEQNIEEEEAQCYPDNRFHGYTDLRRAIAESVNPYFFMIGGGYKRPGYQSEFYDSRLPARIEGLGVDRIEKYLKLFGFSTSTGIDLPGDLAGRVPTPAWKAGYFKEPEDKIWFLGDTYNLSIGQGYMLSTPMQLASAFSAIANNGVLFEPQFVKSIISSETNQTAIQSPKIVRENFVKIENIKIVKEGMRQAVSSSAGSAYLLNSLPVKAAAKTGTAEIYPAEEIYLNWIVVLAPYENPEMVLVVLADRVEGLHVVAQKIAWQILNWHFTRSN